MKISERDIINEINKSNFIYKKDSKELSNNKEELKENENIINKIDKNKIFKNKNKNLNNNEIGGNINNKNNKKKYRKKKKSKTSKKQINNNKILINNVILMKNSKNIDSLPTQGLKKNKVNNKLKITEKENINLDYNLININLNNIEEYTPNNSHYILNNYTYEEALKYDLRSICLIFYIFLLSKQAIFHAFLYKSPLEKFSLRFCLLVFIISSDLALNAIFYLDDKISKKYKNAKNIFLFTFNNNLTIILLSTLIGFIFMTLFTNLSNSIHKIRDIFVNEEIKIKNNKKYMVTEERKKEILEEIQKILKIHKIKIIVLICIEILIMLFFWYYVTVFCHIYSSTQLSWLLDSFLSILSRLFIEILFSLGFAKLYRIAIESNIHWIYKIVLFFYCFG